jgi:hypothetical protein
LTRVGKEQRSDPLLFFVRTMLTAIRSAPRCRSKRTPIAMEARAAPFCDISRILCRKKGSAACWRAMSFLTMS